MITTYRLRADELDEDFVAPLRILFKDKEVESTVEEVDETSYLLRFDANRRHLLQAVENIDRGRSLVEVTADILQ